MPDRRGFLFSAAAAVSSPSVTIGRIERLVPWKGREGGVTWFHPRSCAIPARGQPRLVMTLQSISGSDVNGPVHWSESRDLGLTWTTPAPIPGMGRRRHPDGIEEGFCDTVPEHHARTGAVLAIAQNVYYKDNRLTRPSELRWPVCIVRSRDGRWGGKIGPSRARCTTIPRNLVAARRFRVLFAAMPRCVPSMDASSRSGARATNFAWRSSGDCWNRRSPSTPAATT